MKSRTWNRDQRLRMTSLSVYGQDRHTHTRTPKHTLTVLCVIQLVAQERQGTCAESDIAQNTKLHYRPNVYGLVCLWYKFCTPTSSTSHTKMPLLSSSCVCRYVKLSCFRRESYQQCVGCLALEILPDCYKIVTCITLHFGMHYTYSWKQIFI